MEQSLSFNAQHWEGNTRQHSRRQFPPQPPMPQRLTSQEELAAHAANAEAAAELSRRRERNRLHQAKYKKREKQRMADLEDNIQQLQREIQELRRQQAVALAMPSTSSMWSVAAEYFRLFRYGVQASAEFETECPYEPQVQRHFLQTTMAEDVTDGNVSGANALMECWTRVSLCSPGLAIKLVRMENGPGGVLASTTQDFTITEKLLYGWFPSLAADDSYSSHIVHKLLGQHVVIRGTVHFDWDEESNRMRGFVFKGDIFTPILELLGKLEDVSRVFDNARLTPEYSLVY